LNRARSAIENIYMQACEGWIFRNHIEWFKTGIVLYLALLVAFALSILLTRSSISGFTAIGRILVPFWLAFALATGFTRVRRPRLVPWTATLVIWVIGLSMGAIGTSALEFSTRFDLVAYIVALLLALVTGLGFWWFRVRTIEGRQVKDHIDG